MNALRREYGARRASLSWPLSREEICLPGHAQRFAWEETPLSVQAPKAKQRAAITAAAVRINPQRLV